MAWIPAFAGMTEGVKANADAPTNVMPAQAGIHASLKLYDNGGAGREPKRREA